MKKEMGLDMTTTEANYSAPIDPTDFYGIQDAIARALDWIALDDDPDPKVTRRLRMAYTAAAPQPPQQTEAPSHAPSVEPSLEVETLLNEALDATSNAAAEHGDIVCAKVRDKLLSYLSTALSDDATPEPATLQPQAAIQEAPADLLGIVEQILNEGHINTEDLGTLRRAYESAQPKVEALAQDYEAVLADHRRLVRELDVLLNGEEGAAKQASLCDIVAQVAKSGKVEAQPVRQARHKDSASWYDVDVSDFESSRADSYYEVRTLYTAPQSVDAKPPELEGFQMAYCLEMARELVAVNARLAELQAAQSVEAVPAAYVNGDELDNMLGAEGMTTLADKELLELAAKAYWGDEIDDVCSVEWSDADNAIAYTHGDNQDHNGCDRTFVWDPLENDGDAFRLAVRLHLTVRCYMGNTCAQSTVPGGPSVYTDETNHTDHCAATRRAIVRAAAAIAKEMKNA